MTRFLGAAISRAVAGRKVRDFLGPKVVRILVLSVVVGFAFGYALPRRHGRPTTFLVYEIGVDEPYRRRGIAARLMRELLAGEEDAFVLTEPGIGYRFDPGTER